MPLCLSNTTLATLPTLDGVCTSIEAESVLRRWVSRLRHLLIDGFGYCLSRSLRILVIVISELWVGLKPIRELTLLTHSVMILCLLTNLFIVCAGLFLPERLLWSFGEGA